MSNKFIENIENIEKDRELKYILGLDLGIASVGWSVLSIDDDEKPNGLIDLGIRVFDAAENAKDGKSLNLGRRLARSQRRTIRRRAHRQERLATLFAKYNLPIAINNDIQMTWVELANNKIHTQKPKYYENQKDSENNKKTKAPAEFLPIGIWGWRLLGLEQKLSGEQWAGVLKHLVKHRGYLSQRKSEATTDDKELGLLLAGVSKNSSSLEKNSATYRTPAELAIKEFAKKGHLRNKAGNYSHTFSRLDLKKELELLFVKQREFGNEFTSPEFEEKITNILMYQKDALSGNDLLKMLGFCTFEENEKRAAKATYAFERFIWLQKLANIRILADGKERSLTFEEYQLLVDEPYQKAKFTYNQARKILKLKSSAIFKGLPYFVTQQDLEKKQKEQKEAEEQKEQKQTEEDQKSTEASSSASQVLAENQKTASLSASQVSQSKTENQTRAKNTKNTKSADKKIATGALAEAIITETEKLTLGEMKAYHQIRKALDKAELKDEWNKLKTDTDLLNLIGTAFSIYKTDADIKKHFDDKNAEISTEVLEALLQSLNFTKFGHLSLVALNKLLAKLEWHNEEQQEPITYDKACTEIYGNHYGLKNSQSNRFLPLIPSDSIVNPVVIRTLAQTRKVINAVIRKYGSPARVHIENARELGKSRKDRNKDIKFQEGNRKARAKAEASFKELFPNFVGEPKGKDILKMRLYYAQDGKCVYSGKAISINRLNEPNYVDVDHALPYRRTYDDSYNNKVLVLTGENRDKDNKIPYEWLDGKNDTEKWRSFVARILSCKFSPTKKQIILKKVIDKDFIQRNKNDTRYITRFLANFIEDNLLLTGKGEKRVFTPNGRITSMLRGFWGFAKKRDANNRHHALDAIVVAATQAAIQKSLTDNHKRKNLALAIFCGEEAADTDSILKDDEIIDKETGEIKKFYIPPPWEFFYQEVMARVFNENPTGALAEELPDRSQALHKFVRPLFVSRAPIRKLSGQAHLETIRSANKIDENVGIIKKPLTSLKVKDNNNNNDKDDDITNIVGFREGREKQFYADLRTRLAEHNNDAEKAFAEPFYKKGKSGIKQEVKSVRVKEVQKSGLLLFNNDAEKQKYFANQTEQEKLTAQLAELATNAKKNQGAKISADELKNSQAILQQKLQSLKEAQISPLGVADNGDLVRADVFEFTNNKGKTNYFLVPIYAWQVAQKILPNKAILTGKNEADWQEMTSEYKFIFSLYSNDLVKTKKGEVETFGYYAGVDRSNGQIKIKLHDMDENKGEKGGKGSLRVATKTLDNFEKYQVEILGDYHKVKNEKRHGF